MKVSFACLNRFGRGLETCPQANFAKSRCGIFLFFPTRPSDEYDSAPRRKYSRSLFEVFACIGYSKKSKLLASLKVGG